MKRTMSVAACVLLLGWLGSSAMAALPKDYHEFKGRYLREAVDPVAAARLYFDAMYCYMNPETRQEGSKMLRLSMRMGKGWERMATRRLFASRLGDPDFAHVFRSYAKGTTPENGYAMSPDEYVLSIVDKRERPDQEFWVDLQSSGADSPRRLILRRFDDLWFVVGNSSIYVQTRPPKQKDSLAPFDADSD